jgi:hypothetical protein
VMEIPVRMRQNRMHSAPRESPPGFKCQTRSTSAPGRRRRAARFVRRLQEQHRALPKLPGLFSHAQAAIPGGVGQERPVLLAAGRASLQARHSLRRRPLLRHRSLCAGNACARDRAKHSRVSPAVRLCSQEPGTILYEPVEVRSNSFPETRLISFDRRMYPANDCNSIFQILRSEVSLLEER